MLGNYSKHKSSSKKKYPAFIEELCRQFSLEDVRKSTNNFDEERIIGGTEFSIVYKGYLNHNGETDYPIALKGMRNIVFDEWKFKKEIELNCQLRHPNLTSFIGFCDHKDERILVYEYMLNGSVYDHLRLRDNESLSWKKRFEICIGAAKGLHYLHTGAKRAIFHCDIKPQNILLDKSMVPKLSHLGFSIQEKVSKSKPKPVKAEILIFGAFGYTAPECVRTNAFTEKCDVYSFGMVLLEVACTNYKSSIFDKMVKLENTNRFLDESINAGSFLERFPADEIIDPILMRSIAPRCLEVFVDIMQRCLKYDPNERPTMGEVEVELEHALALHEEADCCR
ncbi:putative receptor-like protein kinase At5g39000 isoform X1 [Vicia villosa]|uniref:putative receptor-like protein kinase At5g39000 isoform X1 n=1 Tax=Vicia villosa TaxID=3911 RepID=UPI00273AA712|nr:putative receptor-like protein kinase At5g39000 isoform X1 [Vicia villosa]